MGEERYFIGRLVWLIFRRKISWVRFRVVVRFRRMSCWLERRVRRRVRKRKVSSRVVKVIFRVTYVSVFSGRIFLFCREGGRGLGELGRVVFWVFIFSLAVVFCGFNFSSGYIYEYSEVRYVVVLVVDVVFVAEDDFIVSGRLVIRVIDFA